MKANAPEKIYVHVIANKELGTTWHGTWKGVNDIEYTRTDAFIERVINFLNYKLDDIVATRVPGTIMPHHVVKKRVN